MKQHITITDLNELSDKAKQKLREWWAPEYGDKVYIPTTARTYSYGELTKTRSRASFLGNLEMDEGIDGWESYDQTPVIIEGEYGDDNYFRTPSQDCFPLLNIGQLIEFIDENTNSYAKCEQIGATASLAIERDFLKKGDSDFILTGWRSPITNQHFGELIDALWEAVKSTLEKE